MVRNKQHTNTQIKQYWDIGIQGQIPENRGLETDEDIGW